MVRDVKVKICGITNEEDALKAVYYGAWALGFIFHKKSPRYISPSKARKIIELLPPFVTPVGVFVNLNERAVRQICRLTRIHTVQLHGDEPPSYCKKFKDYKIIKACRINEEFDFNSIRKFKVDAFLFDTLVDGIYGGSGKPFNWDLLKLCKTDKPVILSGGLNPDNVADAIGREEPFAVDVSSGVEKSPGIKDPRLIRSFFDSVESQKQPI